MGGARAAASSRRRAAAAGHGGALPAARCLRPGAALHRAFHALADPTRRGILERVVREEASISDLAERFGMNLTGVKKRVRVLEDVGLVGTRKEGRVRTVSVGPRPLDDVARWVDDYRRAVEARLDRLEVLLARLQGGDAGT